MTDSRDALWRVAGCFDSMYAVLGAHAGRLSDDACTIRAFEAARAFGDVSRALEEYLGDHRRHSVVALEDALRDALDNDETGAMVLHAVASIVGPRVLVTVRDALELDELDEAARALLARASDVLVGEILAVSRLGDASTLVSGRWPERARELTRRLEESGNAESFGLRG